jgi:O-antigen biosynthesis protein
MSSQRADPMWCQRTIHGSHSARREHPADRRTCCSTIGSPNTPGCNLAVRREALLAIGGFNPIYLRAGDDVDVCWRLQARGGTIGFAPAALVWHHHRASVNAYWRQQVGYGEGEVWLQPHHPNKFVGSRIQWHGHVYSPLPFVRSLFGTRVNAGPWGTAPFPSVYRTDVAPLFLAPHTLSWQVSALLLTVVGLALWRADSDWPGLTIAWAGGLALAVTIGRCVQYALASDIRAVPPLPGRSEAVSRFLTRGMIAWLHLLQPLARMRGRIRGVLTSPEFELAHEPLTRRPAWHEIRDVIAVIGPGRRRLSFWSDAWLERGAVLTRIVERVRSTRIATALEVDDGWHSTRDVSLQLGRWGRLDIQMLIEEHSHGRVLVRVARRFRVTPFFAVALGALLLVVVSSIEATSHGWMAAAPIPFIAVLLMQAIWRAGGTLTLADQVITRVLLDADAVPLGAPAVEIAARVAGSGPPPVPQSLLSRARSHSSREPAGVAPTASAARHAN